MCSSHCGRLPLSWTAARMRSEHCTCEGRNSYRTLSLSLWHFEFWPADVAGHLMCRCGFLDSWPTVVVGHLMETKTSVSNRFPINGYVARPLDRLLARLLARPHLFPSARVVIQICLPSVIIPPAILPDGPLLRRCYRAMICNQIRA